MIKYIDAASIVLLIVMWFVLILIEQIDSALLMSGVLILFAKIHRGN